MKYLHHIITPRTSAILNSDSVELPTLSLYLLGTSAVVVTAPAEEPMEAAGRLAADVDVEAGAETMSLAGFLHKLCRCTCHTLLSSKTALAVVAAVMSSAIAVALPTKAPAAATMETAHAMPDRHRLVASRILADARGKRRLIDRPQRRQKYLESGRIDPPQRWRNYLRSGGTDGAIHAKQRATLTALELEVTNTDVARARSAAIAATRACGRPTHTTTLRRSLNKGRALPPRLATLLRLAFRKRIAHSQAIACNFRTLNATFNSYFVKIRKVQSICHLLGLFPREVIKWGP